MLRRWSPPALLLAGLAAAAAACSKPAVGDKIEKEEPAAATHTFTLTAARVTAERAVQVDFAVTLGGAAVAQAELAVLKPAFTLAEVATDPESGLPAWRSHLLTGAQTALSNPIGGPGTLPANVLEGQRQPGADAGGTVEPLAAGGFRYTFAAVLPEGYAAGHTYRIGAWLDGVAGTAATNATLDLVPAGGTPAPRDLVVDADCQRCHAEVRSHGRRVGVKLCVTCHTYQAVDPDTVDPAAPLAATVDTHPNPLDFGRLAHRIHRGKRLPTLYAAGSAAAAPPLGTTADPPLPFLPNRNALVSGRRYAVVGEQSRVFTFGEARTVVSPDGTTLNKTVALGVTFPRDYRDCAACHAAAPQADLTYTAISRRVCAGCHPDVWFVDAVPPDGAHVAHPGGVQADDTACAGCHLAEASGPKLYVDNRDVHTPLVDHPRFNPVTAAIVSITNLLPGQKPTVVFTVADHDGVLSPLNDPATALPADTRVPPSPVPRKLGSVRFVLAGPTSPDYLNRNTTTSESISFSATIPAADILVADAQGRFTYTFKTATVPETAVGAWTVMLEARRSLAAKGGTGATTPFYDLATDTFAWPYTGEGISEAAPNAIVSVGVESGSSATPALARRTIVSPAKCNVCHKRFAFHGARIGPASCVLCHTPDLTDWNRRPKVAAGQPGAGNVKLTGTLDGLEERSLHFKTMIHRIHTGGRTGSARLDAEPFVLYSGPAFFDGTFPGDLADCRRCHEGETFLPEAVAPDASPTIANENPTLLHAATAAHPEADVRVPPLTAACTSCHDTWAAKEHAASHVTAGVEGCPACHGASGAQSVYRIHGLAAPE